MRNHPPILHIGYPKTGTSFLQQKIFPHAHNAALLPRDTVLSLFFRDSALAFNPHDVLEQLKPYADRRIILSEENLTGSFFTGGGYGYTPKVLAQHLKAVFPEAKVVFMVRNPVSMVASLYRHYVRWGGTYSPEWFMLEEGLTTRWDPKFSPTYLEYDRLIGLYQELFGVENVHIYLFEEFKADNRAFVERLLDDLALTVDEAAFTDKRRVNAGSPDASVRLARVLNHFTRDQVYCKHYWVDAIRLQRVHKIIKKLERKGWLNPKMDDRALLGDNVVRQVETYFQEPNARLAKLLGMDLNPLGYRHSPIADQKAAMPPLPPSAAIL